MAWNYDQPPLNYLKRRIIYYKKQKGFARGILKNEYFLEKYGEEVLKRSVNQRLKRIDFRIKQFQHAIKKLSK